MCAVFTSAIGKLLCRFLFSLFFVWYGYYDGAKLRHLGNGSVGNLSGNF